MFISYGVFAQNTAQEDKLLKTIQDELNRNMEQLKKQDVPVYLLSYRIDEVRRHNMSSTFGALDYSKESAERILTIQVRVGDNEMDNHRELRDDQSFGVTFYSSNNLSLDDDSKSIALTLWRETEKLYKEAVSRYRKVKTSKSLVVDSEDKAADYSDNVTAQYYEKPVSFADLNFNPSQWEQRIKKYSGLFADKKEIHEGSSSFRFYIERKYYVNSEGTSIVQNYTNCRLFISAETQAEDGMKLPVFESYFAHSPAGLPDDNQMTADATKLADLVIKMRTAPTVDAFTGPAVLSKEAAGVFFHEIFGHRVEGYRLKKESDAQTFKKKVNENILNPDISVVFDPTIKEYKGSMLNGSYMYDDEGTKGEKVVVVENGVLKNFLMTRTPIDNFPKTNGHARAQAGRQPVSRQSNLIVETSKPYTDAQLRQMLLDELKKQGKEYGYWFEKVQGGFTQTGRYNPNSFNVTPIEVYRVYADGRPDELVRGVDLVGTPLAMFSKIEAAGDSPGNFAGTCGAESGSIQAGCCSPALLVSQVETQRKAKNQQRAPILERPYSQTTKKDDFSTMAFQAMEDELAINMSQLKLDNLHAPYYISYLITDAKIYSVEASLGGIVESQVSPSRNLETTVLVGNNQHNNLNYSAGMNMYYFGGDGINLPISTEDDYNSIRSKLWASTDQQYKEAAKQLEEKNTTIEEQNIPQEEIELPDFSSIPVQTKLIDSQKETVNSTDLENMAKELSLVFADYPHFTESSVDIAVNQAEALYLNSEGVKYKSPVSIVNISVYAATVTEDGESLADKTMIYSNSLSQLPNMQTLKEQVKLMASLLEQLRVAPVLSNDELYKGAVMFEKEAVGHLVAKSFFETSNGLCAKRKKIEKESSALPFYNFLGGGESGENKLENQIGKTVISKDLSINVIDKTKTYNNIPLIGYYEVDAEGVSSSNNLPLITNGVLQNLLTDRIPTQKFRQSNGHKRLSVSRYSVNTSVAPGVIEMTSKKTMSNDKMKKQLIALGKKQKAEYVYIIRKIDADFSMSNMIANMTRMMSGDKSIKPLYVYRVSVNDGSETLVRMANLSNISLESFKDVVAASDKQYVYNTTLQGGNGMMSFFSSSGNGVPVSLIYPDAIILNDLEVKKDRNIILNKKPVTENPLLVK
jgi:predicted Zn-dependent protease